MPSLSANGEASRAAKLPEYLAALDLPRTGCTKKIMHLRETSKDFLFGKIFGFHPPRFAMKQLTFADVRNAPC